jgi:DNA-binding transcriptional regulator GbsR (MarR family)
VTLSEVRNLSFTNLLQQIGTSRRTLSLTLRDLQGEGLVAKTSKGKYCYYSITKSGLEMLNTYYGSGNRDIVVDRIAQLSLNTLKRMGILEDNEDVTEEQLTEMVKQRTAEFIKRLEQDVAKQLGSHLGEKSQ